MNEQDLYRNVMELCIAHTSTTEWKQVHGFGVGYLDQVATSDNMDKSDFRAGLFYSEKWYENGMNPNEMKMDYPFVLMLPVQTTGEINSKGVQTERDVLNCVVFVLDLLYRDRNGNADSAYAKRSLEQIQADTFQIGKQLLKQFNKRYNANAPKMQLANGGKFTSEKVFEFTNKRFAGSSFQFSVAVIPDCEDGTFDFGKDFPEKKEKFCGC